MRLRGKVHFLSEIAHRGYNISIMRGLMNAPIPFWYRVLYPGMWSSVVVRGGTHAETLGLPSLSFCCSCYLTKLANRCIAGTIALRIVRLRTRTHEPSPPNCSFSGLLDCKRNTRGVLGLPEPGCNTSHTKAFVSNFNDSRSVSGVSSFGLTCSNVRFKESSSLV